MNNSEVVAKIKLMKIFPLAYWISLLKCKENYFLQISIELCQAEGTRLVPFLCKPQLDQPGTMDRTLWPESALCLLFLKS